ncbi:MAG: HEPN domain-containing protein [Candidatus Pacebacteria bacterium]|nr:HEPN domain-containing protein [Candidatus Paceibacterota bacterium]
MKGDFLKKRAQDFSRDAQLAIKEKRWNSAAFHLEQACKFYLKYYLFLKWRDFPKTHSLKELLLELARVYKQSSVKMKKFIKENEHIIGDLEQAYITSRYLPVEFNEKQAREMAGFKNKLINLLKKL